MAQNTFTDASPDSFPLPLANVDAQAIKRAVEAVTDLNIARKNLLIYPASHEQVQRSVQRAFERMKGIASRLAPFTLTVLSERLAIGSHLLEEKGVAIKEMAQTFKQRSVAAITFLPELGQEELLDLLKFLAAEPDRTKTDVGLTNLQGLTHILLHAVDYSKLHLTIEDQVQRHKGPAKETAPWNLFVSQLSAGTAAGPVETALSSQTLFDSRQMAEMLNTRQVDPGQAVAYYRTIMADYMKQVSTSKTPKAISGLALERFNRLLKELHPDLQQQFLAVAFDQWVKHDDPDGLGGLAGGMEDRLVVTMLRQANAQGKRISPSLMAFVKKMAPLSGRPASKPHSGRRADTRQKVQTLLNKEDYESYVDDSYDGLLQQLSKDMAPDDTSSEMAALKSEMLDFLEEQQLAARVGAALESLMRASIDVEEYRDWARQLTFMLDDMIIMGAYGPLLDLLSAVQLQCRGYADSERAKICALVLDHFHSTSFLATAMASLNKEVAKVDPKALTLLERLGEPAIAEAMEFLSTQETIDPHCAVFVFLQQCESLVIEEALERLRDPRPRVICRTLELIRILGQNFGAEGIRKLLAHEDPNVRLEALASLLHFNNPWGVVHLREILTGPWSEAVSQAMQIAGTYKVKEVVPLLVGMVERIGPVGPDMARREAALRTLGAIGDSQALASLTRIARRRWSISHKHLVQLKRVLFESLEGYEFGSVKELLHLGLKQKDHLIASTCWRLLKKNPGDDEKLKTLGAQRTLSH
ncbi:MAG: hypothetical protein M0036_23205 [Desulfobacteraceae bacterium]|nr:hypothetical protein [Desulfobacteraceae bacterium]